MNKLRQEISRPLKANTLVELLFTMTLSGIIFLLVFDGVTIIKEFSNTVNQRIEVSQTMLYSHALMEHLVENADSIIEKDERLLFYKGGIAADSLTRGDSFFVIETAGIPAILFEGMVDYRVFISLERPGHVDSIFINYIGTTGDSIELEYGLPTNRYAFLKTANHEDLR